MTLTHFGMLFPPFSNMYAMASVCRSTFEDKKLVISEGYEGPARLLAKNVTTAAKIIRSVKCTDWKYDYDSN
jgi:hypothetical protein